MKTLNFLKFHLLLVGLVMLISFPFQSCEPDDNDDDCDTCIMVYKPNIYIYPLEATQLKVTIDFPLGGEIITSIPSYVTGWNITVDTNGLIDNTYNYLFYESKQPDVWQHSEGWIIKSADLEDFFIGNLTNYGFFGQEIQDFIDYWIPRLIYFDYYAIYPQNSEIIDKVIELGFSKEPDNLLRLFYVIEGYSDLENVNVTEPNLEALFKREGFFVTEWGVVQK